jgi:hypothetical protein
MRGEWAGAEYRGNLTLATRFIEQELGMPFQEFCAARLPDGRKIGNVPELVMAFSNKGRETFGDSAFANTDVAQKFEDRKKFIENIRDTDFPRYEREFAKEMNSIIETELKRSKK